VQAGKLSPTQVEVLVALAGIAPPWRLSGGGALAGFYTQHRETRDLDLFWRTSDLEAVHGDVSRRLASAGFTAEVLQSSPAFRRVRAARGADVVVVDLVADPVATVADPGDQQLGTVRIVVDAPHEILVNKLCALLSRSELRDLEDVRALLGAGLDLSQALGDAPKKDAGFSPLTLAWVLRELPIDALGRAVGRAPSECEPLRRFRDDLVRDVLALAKPG